MINNYNIYNELVSPIRNIKGTVGFTTSPLSPINDYSQNIKSIVIERTGENNKYFGFGICQKAIIELKDKNRFINIYKDQYSIIGFIVKDNSIAPYPNFFVNDVKRDENTNDLTITAYDALYKASNYKVNELKLLNAYTIADFVRACGNHLGLTTNNLDSAFNIYYELGANFSRNETLREALDAAAEATQTIYYIDKDSKLTFKKLDNKNKPILHINKSNYFSLSSNETRKLTNVIHATELGNNYAPEALDIGDTQYVRDNPFWDLRDDIDVLVNDALSRIGGIEITPFECSWRGNCLLEIGDKISFETKDGSFIVSFVINDTLTYNGSLSQKSSWSYTENDAETPEEPTTLADTISQTYAKVDRVDKRIDLVVNDISENKLAINQLTLDSEGISAQVALVEQLTNDSFESVNNSIETLAKTVETKMTPEQVSIAIKTELDNGASKVATSTGYTFDEQGLTISKEGREMSTQITEDGMKVFRDNSAVLIANNEGVNAENLHATTYLIIGGRCRLENYKSDRTACFWIGRGES